MDNTTKQEQVNHSANQGQGHLQQDHYFQSKGHSVNSATNRGRGRGQGQSRGLASNLGMGNGSQGQPISVVGQTHQTISTVSGVKRGQSRGRSGGVRGRGGHKVQNFGQLQQVHIDENIDFKTYDSVENVQINSNRTVIPSGTGSHQMALNYMGAALEGQGHGGSTRTVIAAGTRGGIDGHNNARVRKFSTILVRNGFS